MGIRIAVSILGAAVSLGAASAAAAQVTYQVGTIHRISQGCRAGAEVEQAVDTVGNYVYEEWMGCGGIGFARSTDGGVTFSTPVHLLNSSGAWDPSVVVAPDGTVYVAFMSGTSTQSFPIVETSFDHGVTFPQTTILTPPDNNNWGDRVFLAVGPDGAVYATWDYGPSAALVKLLCSPSGSCSFTYGDLNAVVQKSTDRGKTFGPMVHVSPNYPGGGAMSAPMVVEPNGQIDLYYQADRTLNQTDFKLAPGYGHFTSSLDDAVSWSTPLNVTRLAGTQSLAEWWIDGTIAMDAGGNLYATWDSQGKNSDGSANDIGWISYSIDHGHHWTKPIQAVPDILNVPHIVEVAGGADGIAYVAWLSDSDPRGYALYLRTFSIKSGWMSAPVRISTEFGNRTVWPGDTFGISTLGPDTLMLSWGSAAPVQSTLSSIFAVPVSVTGARF